MSDARDARAERPASGLSTQPKRRSPILLSGWFTVLLIAASAMIGQAFGRFSYGVLLPALRDDLEISNTLAGLLGAANVGAYLLGTLFVAWATGQFRLLAVFRIGLFLAVTGLVAASVADTASLLAVGLFTAGLGGACLWIPAPAIAADALPDHQRHLAVGLMSSGIGLGIAFVSMLSGSLRASLGDQAWSSVYEIQFGIGLLVLIAVLLIVRHQQDQPSGSGGIGGFSALRRTRGWLSLIIAYSCFGFMYLLVIGFLTTRLEDDSGWSSNDAAFAFTTMGIAMIFGGPMFVTLARRRGVRLALSIAFGLWPLFVGIVLSGHYIATLLACIGLGFLFSALPTLVTLYVVENATVQDYGPGFAAATLTFGLAQTLSPAVGGFVADLSGSFTLVFALSGILGLAGLAASLCLPKR